MNVDIMWIDVARQMWLVDKLQYNVYIIHSVVIYCNKEKALMSIVVLAFFWVKLPLQGLGRLKDVEPCMENSGCFQQFT